ncbi:cysteine proteinase inhibitor 4 [Phtheirospermum japonicum]|uniref:Cysteine proteinase inhibitor 4 n=1 Tax=Phtheirospermum japonicum TaxID=374723 RepID=A0A830CH49_9LAMI|nr:cysteine proteinase inhibitor 4 [Phtheirospermum japonicum]
MALKSHSFLFILLSILVVLFLVPSEASPPPSAPLGDWQVIENVNATAVVKIGKFAVKEHNEQTSESLRFVYVVEGEMQVVSGMKYWLVITAIRGGTSSPGNYSAVVLSQLRQKQNSTQLLSFKPGSSR